MRFLLDTNVVSEWVKAHPDRGVVAWLASVVEDQVSISVVTFELRYGIERMTKAVAEIDLRKWLLEGKVLSINHIVAGCIQIWSSKLMPGRRSRRISPVVPRQFAACSSLRWRSKPESQTPVPSNLNDRSSEGPGFTRSPINTVGNEKAGLRAHPAS